MLWLVTTALAQDVVWSPAVQGDVGRSSLVVADLDGDGLDEWMVDVFDGATGHHSVAVRTGAGDELTFEIPVEVGSMDLYAADMDDDGVDELIVSLPELDDGKVMIVDGAAISAPVEEWEDTYQLYFAEGEGSAFFRFGYAVEVLDLTRDGDPELLFGSPDEGRVYAFSYERGGDVRAGDALGSWSGLVGWDIEPIDDRDGDGVPELVFAACSDDACGGAGMQVVSGADLAGEHVLDPTAMSVAMGELPVALEAVRDHTGDGLGEVAWLSPNFFAVLNPEDGYVVERLSGEGTDLISTSDATGDGLDDAWIAFGGQVVLYADVVVEDIDTTFAVDGVTLGLSLAAAGDVTGDDCEDALAVGSDGSIYLLASSCSTGTETGVGDSTIDSAPHSGGTGSPSTDSADSTTDTDAPFVCEPEFGYGCPGSPAAFLVLLVGAWLIRE